MDTSNHASEAAVRILDEQRSSMSIISQFRSRLQPKRKRPHASAAMSSSASDPHGAVVLTFKLDILSLKLFDDLYPPCDGFLHICHSEPLDRVFCSLDIPSGSFSTISTLLRRFLA
ncbi:hypothetical protein AZE42_13283 [Rhizopogon vesiculosus]|uniref:Uncharacterized protein n=1 Tax=Rhizopogon vesiculosus TaxID=180088 RepID=A0A1J8QIG9_9AGAM|nr:hypothetical protein AZE42_13283 [Rhizopogon vesiculosus]